MPKPNAPKDWTKLIEQYRSSGETQAEFCRSRGLALSTLSLKLRGTRKTKSFVKVGTSDRVELELKDGTLLRVNPTELRTVLKALSDNAIA